MSALFAQTFRLVPRGRAGLTCDDEGVALGPVSLVEPFRDEDGSSRFRTRSVEEVSVALKLAYGAAMAETLARRHRSLAHIAELLTAGEATRARLHAMMLGFPAIDGEGMAKLRGLADTRSRDARKGSVYPEPDGGVASVCEAHARRPSLHQDESDRRGRMRDRFRRRESDVDPRLPQLRDCS